MTGIGESLLIAATCLFFHWFMITSLVEDFGALPDDAATRWRRLANRRPDGHSRIANAVVAGLYLALCTWFMALFLLAGGHMTLIWRD